MDSLGFPSQKLISSRDYLHDLTLHDLDHAREFYSLNDMQYMQLSQGAYKGRIIRLDLGQLTIGIRSCNQSTQVVLNGPPDRMAFFLQNASPTPSPRIFGAELSSNTVTVERRCAWSDYIAPRNSSNIVLSVHPQALIESGTLISGVAEWLSCENARSTIINSKYLADTLRSNAWSAVEFASSAKTSQELDVIAQSIIFSIGSALTITWIQQNGLPDHAPAAHYERFHEARKLLLNSLENNSAMQFTSDELEPLRNLGSKRSIEQAFTANVSMGPLSYLRVIRLHNARSKLLQPDRLTQNIGDIAAEEGFWDKSKFSMQYQKHFGERPSDTRSRVIDQRPKFRYKAPRKGKRQKTANSH